MLAWQSGAWRGVLMSSWIHSPNQPSSPTIRVDGVVMMWWSVNGMQMANAFWLKWRVPGSSPRSSTIDSCRRRECKKTELHIADQLVHRVTAVWQNWWRIVIALVRLGFKRRCWSSLGAHLRDIKSRGSASDWARKVLDCKSGTQITLQIWHHQAVIRHQEEGGNTRVLLREQLKKLLTRLESPVLPEYLTRRWWWWSERQWGRKGCKENAFHVYYS